MTNIFDGAFKERLKKHTPTNDLFKKAIGFTSGVRNVFDATGGYLKDSLVMASWGCQVTVCERNQDVFDQVSEALFTLQNEFEWIAERVSYLCIDSILYMQKNKMSEKFESIYIDPIYPAKESSALNKKNMRDLKSIVGEDLDAGDLLRQALLSKVARVLLKRPSWLRGVTDFTTKPAHIFEGKTTDYYLFLKATDESNPID